MPHLHHGALGSFGSVFLTVTIVFTALVYLRGWLHLRSKIVNGISAWCVCSFLVGLFLIWAAVASPIAAPSSAPVGAARPMCPEASAR